MKKWLFWLGVAGLLTYGVVRNIPEDTAGRGRNIEVQVQTAMADASPKDGQRIKVLKNQIYKGNLLLVNKNHPVPAGGEEANAVFLSKHQELVKSFGLLDRTIQLSKDMVQKFSTMVAAAEQEGVNRFLITSGYRNHVEQGQLYKQMGADYAMPAGYSEHNLGLSIDIGSEQGEMDKAPEGKWLKQNAWKYGFILRYPKNKTDITGIQYEPWHFRYVGLPHSAVMQENGWVLEEYLDYLKDRKSVTVTVDHSTCSISYYPVTQSTTIEIPSNGRYEISGNNVDGVIVTVCPDRKS
ncbi:MAG: M15 family metallopeptidase [Bacillota bacterium]